MNRDYLQDIEIVGALLVSREGKLATLAIDWLQRNCDRVCIVLDNHDKDTEDVVMNFKENYPEQIQVNYSGQRADDVQPPGYIKTRFNKLRCQIRESVVDVIKEMNATKKIDILIIPDADEIFIDEFPKYLEQFWNEPSYKYMMTGFVEVYDDFKFLVKRSVVPAGRVYKYVPDFSYIPRRSRNVYNPYFTDGGMWKVRDVSIHLCQLTEYDRQRRWAKLGKQPIDPSRRQFWVLPKDVRKMTKEEISEYSGVADKAITLKEYNDNKEKFLNL